MPAYVVLEQVGVQQRLGPPLQPRWRRRVIGDIGSEICILEACLCGAGAGGCAAKVAVVRCRGRWKRDLHSSGLRMWCWSRWLRSKGSGGV